MNRVSAWTWAAALGLALSTLPAAAVGAGGWVAPLLALPVVWVAEWLLRRVAGEGLNVGFCRVLGKGCGRTLTIIYMVWAAVLGGVQLRGSVRRVETAVSLRLPSWLLAALVVGLALWAARGKTESCARWGRTVLKVLLVALTALVALALRQVRWGELLPLRLEGTGLLWATAAAVGAFCVRVYAGFLCRGGMAGGKSWYPALVCGLLAVLLLTVQGALGTELAARLEDPLLTLSRNVGVEGTFQRVESLLAAGLLLADLALLTLLFRAGRCGMGKGKTEVVVLLMAVGTLLCALWPAEEVYVRLFRQRFVPVATLGFGLVTPAVVAIIDCVKGRKERAYLVAKDGE